MKTPLCIKAFFAAMACALICSCSTPKNITYMQGLRNNEQVEVTVPRRLIVRPDDKLSILVSSKDPELARVFNLAISQNSASGIGSGNSNQGTSAFTVAPDGYITYPILGKIHVAGLTRLEMAQLIADKIMSENLLKDPVVTVEFLNATVTVLGDVGSPGDHAINRDNMTILQAIAEAGDLKITGMRENVLVLRETPGGETAYRVDLTDTESLMSSPVYYVQQNDVIYVEPNSTMKRQADANGNTFMTPAFWMSVVSFIVTMTTVIIVK